MAITQTQNIELSQLDGTWAVDTAHSTAEFAVRHLGVATVRGRFNVLGAEIELDSQNPERSRLNAWVDAASIDTREPNRDAHLRSPDFLDVENHPQLSFRSREVSYDGEEGFSIAGDLTIRGVTRPVELEGEFHGVRRTGDKLVAGFSAATSIDRREFGLGWNQALEGGGLLVGHKVRIYLDIEAVKKV